MVGWRKAAVITRLNESKSVDFLVRRQEMWRRGSLTNILETQRRRLSSPTFVDLIFLQILFPLFIYLR